MTISNYNFFKNEFLGNGFFKVQILGEQTHFYPNLFILRYNLKRMIQRWKSFNK